jgi:Prokaryotic E2 family E/Multiubiquitin
MQPATATQSAAMTPQTILVAGEDLAFREIQIMAANPMGRQILTAAGAEITPESVVLQLLPSGELEAIRLDEHANLGASNRFLLSAADRAYYFTVDGTRLEWPHRCISARAARVVAEVSDDREICIERPGGHLVALKDDDLVDLGKPGVEALHSRPKVWLLRIQGVLLEYGEPTVKVADAMKRAGFDPTKAWHIYLIVAGQPKQEVTADYVVDLRTPGIEKIRLMQRNVNNGEGPTAQLSRDFALLEADVAYLNALGLPWETVIDQQRRWLLIHGYKPMGGYQPAATVLALDIPIDYPAAQIDMFYFSPWVARADQREIPSTQIRVVIRGVEYQGWSRHRTPAAPWDPNSDNVATHLALVEGCMAMEMGE